MNLEVLMPLGIALVVVAALIVIGFCVNASATKLFLEQRFEFAMRLWAFWGPRLTDRTFLSAVAANFVALNFIDPAKANGVVMAIWVGANMFLPIWDNQPAGEKVLRGRAPDEAPECGA